LSRRRLEARNKDIWARQRRRLIRHSFERRYVYADGMSEPLMQYEGSGISNRIYFHADERDSIIAHSDSNAAVTASNVYDEYGFPASAAHPR